MANFKDGIIREENTSLGCGIAILNVKDGIVRKGNTSLGDGQQIGRVSDYKITGMGKHHGTTDHR